MQCQRHLSVSDVIQPGHLSNQIGLFAGASADRRNTSMTISLYDLSVNSYLQILGGVAGWLEKALAYGCEPVEITQTRLHPAMNPFDFQVQAIPHHSISALCAVNEVTYIAKPEIPQVSYEALQKIISAAQEIR